MSLLPQDHAPRAGSLLSIGVRARVPVPVPRPEYAHPRAEQPQTDEAAAEADDKPETPVRADSAKGYPRLVKVPLPPIPDRPKPRAGAIAAAGQTAPGGPEGPATQVTALAPMPAPNRQATGIFSLFTAPQAADADQSSGDSALVRPVAPAVAAPAPGIAAQAGVSATRSGERTEVKVLANLDIEDPFRKKRMTNPKTIDEETEDDDDFEAGKVEKQIDSVQISCLKPELMAIIKKAGEHFKTNPVITSGYRGTGRRGSLHRRCEAADFFIPDVSSSELVGYLRKLPEAGGVGTYCHTKSVHIDIGDARDWRYCGRGRSYFALRAPVATAARQ